MTKKPGFRETRTPHTSEFSRRADSYSQYNIIQKKVVRHLMKNITGKPAKILDLGCGRGGVYEYIDWHVDKFVGIDKADQMCALHPKNDHITLLREDFENDALLHSLGHFDIVIASSALQWANDLPTLLKHISTITDEVALAIFCSNTFQTIYEMTDMESFLPKSTELVPILQKHFDIKHEIQYYKLDFPDNLSKFRYIKKSGVSGGKRRLTVSQTRKLIQEYPHSYLEFEVLFCWGRVKR